MLPAVNSTKSTIMILTQIQKQELPTNTTIKSGLQQEQQDKNRAAKEIFFQFYID